MKIKLKTYIVLIISFFNFILLNNQIVKAETEIDYNKIYKIGVIDFDPYVKVNDKKEVSGYYIDLFDLIAEELNLNYEYVLVNNIESINKVESGELDFSLGITITSERAERVMFNLNSIALEKFALYTNKNINEHELYKLNGLRFGTVKGRSTDWILNFFEASNLDVKVVYGESYDEINEFIKDGKIDLLLDSAYKETNYNKIYEFVESQVYIAANKNNKFLLNEIDKIIYKLNNDKDNKIDELYNSYFNKELLKQENILKNIKIVIYAITIGLLLVILLINIKKIIYKIYIRSLLKSEIYRMYYQPIYKLKNKEILGLEGLLDKNSKYNLKDKEYLIKKINDKKIACEVFIWKLNEVIYDYKKVKSYEYIKNNFYISLNIPILLLKNEKFVQAIIKILKESGLRKNNICLEIIGGISNKNINNVSKNIDILKDAGFMIALDDFGIEYSNLNIIQNLNVDVIKVNRNFTKDINKSIVKSEIVSFILKIATAKEKVVILEGIDNLEQHKKIKEIENYDIYVQGNFYSKPMSINDINKII